MSCCNSCGDTTDSCGCNPCAQTLKVESQASALQNLEQNLFGTFTKTIVNGRAVWTQVCDSESTGLSCNPRSDGEGFICYILRLMDGLGLFYGGTWNALSNYCKNTFVIYGIGSYVALVDVAPGVTPGTDGTKWQLILAGSPGPQGPPGAAGSGAPSTFAHRSTTISVTLTNTDDVVLCSPAADIIITIPAMTGLDDGKGYQIINLTGAHLVTIVSATTDTFDGGVSIVLSLLGESITLRSDHAGKWISV